MRLLKTRYQRIDGVEFSAGGGLLAHGSKGAVFWPNPTGEGEPVKVSEPETGGAAFVGPDAQIVYCDSTGVHLFLTSDQTRCLVSDVERCLYSVTAVGDCRFILFGRNTFRRPILAYSTRLPGDPQLLWSRTLPDCSNPVCVSDREFLQFESWRSAVFRSVATGEEIRRHSLQTPVYSDPSMGLSPDGRWFAHPLDNEFAVVDITSLGFRVIQRTANTDLHHFTGLAFHPSGRYLAATSNDATVKLYDTSNWSLATTYTWDVGRMRSVAFSPDGLLAAAGSDTGRVVVWDVDV